MISNMNYDNGNNLDNISTRKGYSQIDYQDMSLLNDQ